MTGESAVHAQPHADDHRRDYRGLVRAGARTQWCGGEGEEKRRLRLCSLPGKRRCCTSNAGVERCVFVCARGRE